MDKEFVVNNRVVGEVATLILKLHTNHLFGAACYLATTFDAPYWTNEDRANFAKYFSRVKLLWLLVDDDVRDWLCLNGAEPIPYAGMIRRRQDALRGAAMSNTDT